MRGRKIFGIAAMRWRTQWAETTTYVVHEPLFCFISASHDGDDNNNMARTATYGVNKPLFHSILVCTMATTKGTISCASTQCHTMATAYHIVLRDGDDDKTSGNNEQRLLTTIPCARAHYMSCYVRVTTSYHSNTGKDDDNTNVNEQAVCIASNIGATINYKRHHRHYNRYLLNRRRQLS